MLTLFFFCFFFNRVYSEYVCLLDVQVDPSVQDEHDVAATSSTCDAVIGTSSGKLIRLSGAHCRQEIVAAHEGPVLAARTLYDRTAPASSIPAGCVAVDAIVTASSDGYVTLWDVDLVSLFHP
jgi:hypothetical protein